VLLYTGQRKDEVRSLVWGDLHLDEVQPYVLVRESTTKNKDKRAVPLHRDLAALLPEMRLSHATPTTSVFFGRFPTYASLRVIEGFVSSRALRIKLRKSPSTERLIPF
jgi:integrase